MKRSNFLGVVVCILTVVFVVVAFVTQEPIISAKSAELKSVNSDMTNATSENVQLKKEKKRVGTKEFIEEVARRNLGLVKPNEIIFFDIDK